MKRTRLRPRSTKRAAQAKAFAPVIEECLTRDGCRCQFTAHADNMLDVYPPPCWGSLHPHHILPRSRGGADQLDNLVTLCAGHHQYVHEHPLLAKLLGLLR